MFLKKCHKKLAVFLKERVSQGIDKLVVPADHKLDVQGMVNFGKSKGEKDANNLVKANYNI